VLLTQSPLIAVSLIVREFKLSVCLGGGGASVRAVMASRSSKLN
jgi:hypothetical protein